MICPKCSAHNDDSAQVCIECGEPLDTEEIVAEDKNAKLEELKQKRIRKKKNKQRKKIILICLIIAIILGGVAYGIYHFGDGFIDRTDTVVVVTATPTPTEKAEVTPTPEPTATAEATATAEPTEAPVVIEPTVPVTTASAKPAVKTPKPAAPVTRPAVSKATPKPATAPAVSAPGFVAGSVVQPEVPQGNPITSTLISVNAIETAEFSGKQIAKFTIGNKAYYAYADNVSFDKGVPGMYSIDAVPTADIYYGQPVYTITKISSYATDSYVIPTSSQKLLTEADLAGLTKAQLDLARNEIFARHGRVFKRQELQKYFESKTWYKKNSSYNYSNDYLNLSETEVKNAKFILEYENR